MSDVSDALYLWGPISPEFAYPSSNDSDVIKFKLENLLLLKNKAQI